MKQYVIVTKWSNKPVFRTDSRWLALEWLENNNDPDIFKLAKVKKP